MAITDVNLSGYVRADDGAAVSSITISLLHATTDAGDIDGGAETTTTTSSTGYWTFTEADIDATYDIKITSEGGGQLRYIPWADEITLKTVDTSALKVRGVEGAAAPIYLFADQADQDIDVWRINAADGGALTFDSRASGSSDSDLVAQMTITPHATVASSSVTIPGILDINGSVDWDVTDVQVDSSGDIDLVSTANAAAAIYLQENGGTSGTIKIHADQGTSESSIQLLSDAGGVDINAATGKDVDIAGGTVNLTSSDDAASAIYVRANAGTSETIKIHADQGTSESSIQLLSDAGGVDINAATGKDVDIAGGTVNITSSDNAASAIYLRANAGTSETVKIHSDQGTGTGSIQLLSDAGGITFTAGADIELAATNDINIPADVGLTFGDDGEKIEGDGTNLVVASSGTLDMNSGGVLTLDSGAAINIEPVAGSAILLDGTISIDAGVVTGATSITSTAFVGDITGDVTGNTSGTALTVTQAAQTAITSVGTLTALQVDYINANASTVTVTDSSDTGDYASLAVTTHGATTLTTVDDDAHAANLAITVDGSVTIDAVDNIELDSATGIWVFEDDGTEVLRFTESGSGDVTVKLAVNAKDLIFTDNGDAEGFRILDAAAGVKVPGEVMTTKVSYTDGDDAITIADGGGITTGAGLTVTGDVVLTGESIISTSSDDLHILPATGNVIMGGTAGGRLFLHGDSTSNPADAIGISWGENESTQAMTFYYDGAVGQNVLILKSQNVDPIWTIDRVTGFFIAHTGMKIGVTSNNNWLDIETHGGGSTTMYIGNETITTSSDSRVKEDIADTSVDAVELLDKMRIVDFTWNDVNDTSDYGKNYRGRYVGMVAQETIKHAPWIINDQGGGKDCPQCSIGNECDEHLPWHVEYHHLVPTLVKAIQELNKEISILKGGN
jgi:hypothetical protein